jgi:hypothetical protein
MRTKWGRDARTSGPVTRRGKASNVHQERTTPDRRTLHDRRKVVVFRPCDVCRTVAILDTPPGPAHLLHVRRQRQPKGSAGMTDESKFFQVSPREPYAHERTPEQLRAEAADKQAHDSRIEQMRKMADKRERELDAVLNRGARTPDLYAKALEELEDGQQRAFKTLMTAAPDLDAATSDIIDAMEDERLRGLARYVFDLGNDIDAFQEEVTS